MSVSDLVGWLVRLFIVEFIQVILLTINLPLFDFCGYIIDWFGQH
jgi:hypothetical protein